MDSSIIAVLGTLGGVIVSFVGAHFIQKRQREWSLKDEARNKQYELEREQRRIKRELLSKRLEVVEETVSLRMMIIRRSVGAEMGLPTYDDKERDMTMGKRLKNMVGPAWASIAATGSKAIVKYWLEISSAYWALMKNGHLETEQWKQAQVAYLRIVRLMDEMKSEV